MGALNPLDDSPLSAPERLLAAYANLLARSSRMLACVREQDWFALVEEQSCYVIEVEAIAKAEAGIELSEAQKEYKADLLEKILEQDLEIRQRLLKRRSELQKQIEVAQRRRNLARSYGALGRSDLGYP